jgi:hypothetical protein
MPKYRVTFVTVASWPVEIEAEDQEAAIEAAFGELPSSAHNWPEIGDWTLPSDLFPQWNKPEDDAEEIN